MKQTTINLELTVHPSTPLETWHAKLERRDTHEQREFQSALELARYLEHLELTGQKTSGVR